MGLHRPLRMNFKTKFVASIEALEQFNNHGCRGGRRKVRCLRKNFQKSCKGEKDRLVTVFHFHLT